MTRRRSSSNSSDSSDGCGCIIFIIVLALLSGSKGIVTNLTRTDRVIEVTKLERSDDQFLVFARELTQTAEGLSASEKVTTYAIEDSMWHFRWDSADMYGNLSPGQYKVKTSWFRFGFMNWKPNIYFAERLPDPEPEEPEDD